MFKYSQKNLSKSKMVILEIFFKITPPGMEYPKGFGYKTLKNKINHVCLCMHLHRWLKDCDKTNFMLSSSTNNNGN